MLLSILLLLHLSTVESFTVADCPHPSSDYLHDDVCYWTDSANKQNFYNAMKTCRAQGGEIPSIDVATYNVIWPGVGFTPNKYWFGGYDAMSGETAEREWFYVNGAALTSPPWDGGQPNGYPDASTAQDCITVYSGGVFEDNECDTSTGSSDSILHFLCSHDLTAPSHTCITSGDCLSDGLYERVYRQPFHALDTVGSGPVTLLFMGQCAIVCTDTPGCETFVWSDVTLQCERYGHIYLLTRLDLALTDSVMYTRYKYLTYTEGDLYQ